MLTGSHVFTPSETSKKTLQRGGSHVGPAMRDRLIENCKRATRTIFHICAHFFCVRQHAYGDQVLLYVGLSRKHPKDSPSLP